jgi:hypothetical protein
MALTGGAGLSVREEGNGRWWASVGRKQGWAAGDWVGFAVFFFFLFFFFSNPFLNQFQTFLDSKLLHLFKFNFNTNLSNYFKGFSQTIFNNFSNIF